MNVSSATDPFLTANTASSGMDSSSSTMASDFSALTTAIQSGNSSDAQAALTQLEEDSPTLAKAIENASPSSALGSLTYFNGGWWLTEDETLELPVSSKREMARRVIDCAVRLKASMALARASRG